MSSSPITDPGALLGRVDTTSLPAALVRPVRIVAFWMAVILPFLYIPLLASGLQSQSQTLTFIGLIALNVCALVIGQGYSPNR